MAQEKANKNKKISKSKLLEIDHREQVKAIRKSQAVVEFNMDGTIVFANDIFLDTMGYGLDEVKGKHHSIFLAKADRDSRDYRLFWEDLNKGVFQAAEFKRIGKSGKEVWIQATYTPILDPDGNPFKVVKYAKDVSQQKLENANYSGQIDAIKKSQAVVEFNMDGTIIDANDKFLKLMAYSIDEIRGRHHNIFVDAAYRESDEYKRFWEILNKGSFHSAEYQRISKEGKAVWIQGSYNPILDLNGNPYKVVKYATDISAQKLIQQEVEQARTLLEEEKEKLKEQDWLKSNYVKISESLKGMETMEALAKALTRRMTQVSGANVGVIYSLENFEGEPLYSIQGSYGFDPEKQIIKSAYRLGEGLIGQCAEDKESVILEDLPTDYIKVSSALGETEVNFSIILPISFEGQAIAVAEIASFETIPDLKIELLKQIADGAGPILQNLKANIDMKALLEKTQEQAQELKNQQDELKTSNEELEQRSTELRAQQEELERTNTELEEQRATLEEQKLHLETANSELEEAKQDLQLKAQDLERTGKYKSEFLANMSHELRTPLNSILILSKLLQEDQEAPLNDEQKENARIINSSGADLLNLINDILDLSKVEAGKMDLNHEQLVIKDLAEHLNSSFKTVVNDKGLDFVVEVSPECPGSIVSDSMRLEQVVKNLLSNAIKFTNEGQVKLEFAPLNEEEISLTSEDLDLAIRVHDSGVGIAEEDQERIFEAFKQADGTITRKFGGTGLGLSISQSLANMLGGQIIVRSEEGKGSCFSLCLPLEAEDLSTVSLTNEPHPSDEVESKISFDDRDDLKPGDKLILIVDDDMVFAKSLMRKCHEFKYKAIISPDAKSAKNDLRKYNPTGVLLDINLPDESGLVLLDKIKNSDATSSIPVYTMSVDKYKDDSVNLGAEGFIDKINNNSDLELALKRMMSIWRDNKNKILVIEDDQIQRDSIVKLISNESVVVNSAHNAQEAFEMLTADSYSCIVLDLNLPDMNGIELLNRLKASESITEPPAIIYTGKELSDREEREINEYTKSIIIKSAKSPERLLNEISLFLNKIDLEKFQEDERKRKPTRHREKIFIGKKILIVDDDLRNTHSIKQVLGGKNLKTFIATDGLEAVEAVKANPEVDMILMDIMMPKMDGYEAIKKIREHYPKEKLPIIALTAKAMKDDKEKCINAGANDYLPKPIDPESLLSLMRIWLTKT